MFRAQWRLAAVSHPDQYRSHASIRQTSQTTFPRSLPSLRHQDATHTPAGDAVIATEIDRFADSVDRNVPMAGMSIVVTRSGQTVVSRGYGGADVSTGRPMTETTASRIGSITKVFTAMATMKLVEQGKIDLDGDVRAYLPRLTLPPVTVRQALSHTSGLPDYAEYIFSRRLVSSEARAFYALASRFACAVI